MMDFSQMAVSIDMQRQGASVMIRPHIENPTPVSLQYRMLVKQISVNGNSEINQAGDVQSGVAGNTVSLNIPEGADCRVHLEIYQHDTLIKAVDRSCSGLPG